DRPHGAASRLQRRAGRETAEHGEPPRTALLEDAGEPADFSVHRHRDPQIEPEPPDRSLESGRRDADDRHIAPVDPHTPADDAAVSTETLPEPVADDDDRRPSDDGIVLRC